MPLNKEALIRYRVINRLLVDKKYVPKKELISACEQALDIAPIGIRTIDQDISDMRNDDRLGFNAPIKFSREKGGYYYEDTEYSIDNIPINTEELNALSFAANLLKQYKNVDLFETFSGAVQKISDVINIRRMQHQQPFFEFIEFEKDLSLKGSDFLEPIIEAIQNKLVINVYYKRFDIAIEKLHTIHPCFLKEYRQRWYLIGYHNEYKDIRTYALDRINNIESNKTITYISQNFNYKAYFKDTIGIYAPPDEKPFKVKLKFNSRQGNYIISQPIHESQVIVAENNEHLIIEINVLLTYEIISMILSWGDDVQVLEPKELVAIVISKLDNTRKKY